MKRRVKTKIVATVLLAGAHVFILIVSACVGSYYEQQGQGIADWAYYSVLMLALCCLVVASIKFVKAFSTTR